MLRIVLSAFYKKFLGNIQLLLYLYLKDNQGMHNKRKVGIRPSALIYQQVRSSLINGGSRVPHLIETKIGFETMASKGFLIM